MKKRILGFLLIVAMVLGVAGILIACGEEKADYTVTVRSVEKEPMSGIEVSWMAGSKKAGSATTGEDGKATASLPLANYTIALEGLGEGYSYTSASVSPTMKNVTLTLAVTKVTYTVSVRDMVGSPAPNVSVTWTSESGAPAGTAVTDKNGKASAELDYGNYSVTLSMSSLPAGNTYDGAKTVSGKNPSATFSLRSSKGNETYSVTVRSQGGLLFKNQAVNVLSGSSFVDAGWTDENGVFTFTAEPKNYTVRLGVLPAGYTQEPALLTAATHTAELILTSAVITSEPAATTQYVIGDIIHNYTFTTPYQMADTGEVWSKSVAEILQEKELLLINNWGTQCTWCVNEMASMQSIYEKYGDQIEIVAVSNYYPADTDATISAYQAKNGYTFPMMRDTNGFRTKFNLEGWPTTVVVDRYGAIARIEVGAITSDEAWERLVEKYIGDDYKQTFVPGVPNDSINSEVAKPDITLPDDHYEELGNTINQADTFPEGSSIEWFGETEYEYAWPFLFKLRDDVSSDVPVMYASNTGKANSMAIIYATVTVGAGKVLTFDYYADTEADYDVLYITWDGRIIKDISGDSHGWQTLYLFSDITNGSHDLAITYIKDSSTNKGKDNVFIRNVRFVDVTTLDSYDKPVDMLRTAAYGDIVDNRYSNYVDVTLASDGFYHVNLSSLQNANLAGNDESPLLLVNLLNVTAWSGYSLSQLVGGVDETTGDYAFNCTFEIDGVTRDYRGDFYEYMLAASSSYVRDCVPVDAFLQKLLSKFMAQISGEHSHEKEWLEVCYFYSHYGAGEPIGNPILGVMDRTAIEIEAETRYEADLTRVMAPFPVVRYTFTPEESAVYKFESFISSQDAAQYSAQIWLYEEGHDPEDYLAYSGFTRRTFNGVNMQNFELYYYLTAGKKYFVAVAFLAQKSGTLEFEITNVGQEATEFAPCSDDIYSMILDENDSMIGLLLSGAIEYDKDDDGYFYAKNPDGSKGSYIYLDVLSVNTDALGGISLKNLVNIHVPNPEVPNGELDYLFFDFRYCVVYHVDVFDDGEIVTVKNNKERLDIRYGGRYKDYTAILQSYIDAAPTSGDMKGLIKVNDELVEILKLYIELRLNAVYDSSSSLDLNIELALDNEWLRFCWYYRKHDKNNP